MIGMDYKKALKAVIFLIIVLFIGISVSYIVRTNGEVKDRFAGFYAEPKDTIDVMMYGASPIGVTFVPGLMWKETGITSYSLSSNSQNPAATKYLIDETLKYQHPQLIVIEPRMFLTDPVQMSEDKAHIREVADNLKYSPVRLKLLNALLSEDDNKLEYYVDIIKYHSNIRLLFMRSELAKFDFTQECRSKGYSYHTEVNGEHRDDEADTEGTIPIPAENEEVLVDLLDYCKQHDLDVLFVTTPRIIDSEYEKQMNYIQNIVEAKGYDFINMNRHLDDIGFDFEKHFYNATHINVLGAYVCTQYLAGYIQDRYDIVSTDKLPNEGSWEQAYEDYISVYEEVLKSLEAARD